MFRGCWQRSRKLTIVSYERSRLIDKYSKKIQAEAHEEEGKGGTTAGCCNRGLLP
jgi:hypothetical protein